ncbi:Nif3-like dinuclear metal center hexameric protein [Deltaproteobacteria bacterium Smac51]|nr:Nif3-like dinuclear metal center hexameric protein [Deltaproteobacteria bacterium Smac51]
MRVRDFIQIIHQLAPPDLAMEWDNSGLQVGSLTSEVKKIGLALDATSQTVSEALDSGCNLLLTHHPLIFKPLKNISTNTMNGEIIRRALAGGLSIFAAHTNWDSVSQGVAGALADLLELEDRRPLEPAARDFFKLVIYVPAGYEAEVKKAVFEAGAGTIGDYDRCWFSASGEGGFRVPPDGAPFIGQPGQEARTRESRLEVIVPKGLADRAVLAVLKSHPYSEPAFELYPVKTYARDHGAGLIGSWPSGRDILAECRARLGLGGFKWAGPEPGRVKTVALLPGSGGSYMNLAKSQGAEVLITGDVGYHQALEAEHLGITILDLGHYETEWPGVVRLKNLLAEEFEKRNLAVECRLLTQERPWHYDCN